MSDNSPHTLNLNIDSPEAEAVREALSAKQRFKLLSLLTKQAMNVNDIAAALGITHATASVHIKALEKAGLVASQQFSTAKGAEKRCWAVYRKVVFEADAEPLPGVFEFMEQVSMPIGVFTAISIKPPCGLATDSNIIGANDDPQAFLQPERVNAQIMWFEMGWVEYTFPCPLTPQMQMKAVEFTAEICSETAYYRNDWPSDITLWINGHEVGTWTSPGDFGGRSGRLNPSWWPAGFTQYGKLKTWRVEQSGCKIDGECVADTRISELHLHPDRPVCVRIGVKDNAKHQGGINLFGRAIFHFPHIKIDCKYKTV